MVWCFIKRTLAFLLMGIRKSMPTTNLLKTHSLTHYTLSNSSIQQKSYLLHSQQSCIEPLFLFSINFVNKGNELMHKILISILLTLIVVSHSQHWFISAGVTKWGLFIMWCEAVAQHQCLFAFVKPHCVRLTLCVFVSVCCAHPYLFYPSVRDATSDLICSSRANWNLYSASRCGHCPRWKSDSPFCRHHCLGM